MERLKAPRRTARPRPVRRSAGTPWYRRYSGLILLLLLMAGAAAHREDLVLPGTPSRGTARVIDGDSLKLDGLEIRLKGIDAPELHQTCMDGGGNSYPCGREAREVVASLVRDRTVDCRGVDTDRYGRTLAYCVAGGVDVNREMVSRGMAVAYGRLSYLLVEHEARQAKRGLWRGSFETPQNWRDRHRAMQQGGMTDAIPFD